MIYKEFQGEKLSALGLGAMRLPVLDGDDSKVDEAAAAKMVARAMEAGINYYDTAWGYHGGNSERILGGTLRAYPRESYNLATKFPGYDLSNMGKAEEIFEEQLKRCGVEYFDYYLLHNVCEMNIDAYLDKQYGTVEYLAEQKRRGRIRHLGFSTHGALPVMERFLAAYGDQMELCQIQLNWLDWVFQEGKEKVELLRTYGLPIWVMEPLRGGKLAKLAEEDAVKLKALRPGESTAGWAFRFLQGISGVVNVLSGMSNLQQLEENLATFETEQPLNAQELDVLRSITGGMLQQKVLPCTACHYCTSHCPKHLDIPMLLELYNEHNFTGGGFIAPMALMAVPQEKHPSACVGCRSCEAVCPQQLGIAEAMADFAAKLKG